MLFSLASYLVLAQEKQTDAPKLLMTQTVFEVGDNMTLIFSSNGTDKPLLYCSNSYGGTLITPNYQNSQLHYELPRYLTTKRGVVTWRLIDDANTISGQFSVKSKANVEQMESYLGPPSIEAGEKDYTMLVVIPTDALDNPLKDNTQVNVKHQFLETETSEAILVTNLIAHKKIYSKRKTGRMIVASECLGVNSKEYDVNVMPGIPTEFQIFETRHHDYADGNQITVFTTSIIKDINSNIVADGTQVEFFIKTKEGTVLKTSGNTIRGVATAKMIHPDQESEWRIKAYVNGMSESNVMTLKYKSVITDFDVDFSADNRTITIGPLKSFMNQFIPNGLQVTIEVYKEEMLINTIVKYSNEGYGKAYLKADIYTKGEYVVKIKTAGVQRVFNIVKLN